MIHTSTQSDGANSCRVVFIGVLLSFVVALLMGSADGAAAANIVVNSLADTQANDGACTLREAIINANGDNQSGSTDCATGGGADTITFDVNGTVTLNSTLPAIDSDITVDGESAITISGDSSVTVFVVNSAKSLRLQNMVVTNGSPAVGRCQFFSLIFTCGGGVYNNGGTVTITRSTFSDNNSSDFGGGVASSQGTVTVTNSTFSGGTTAQGGGISDQFGTLTVTNSTFFDNSAVVAGGGIFSGDASMLTVTNSTFSGNSAGRGGGISNEGTVATVTNSTFSGNGGPAPGHPPGPGSGSGINNDAGLFGFRPGTLSVTNSIFANSTCRNASTLIDGGNNIDDGTTCGFSVANDSKPSTDPLLGNFLDPGIPGTGRFPLRSASPAVDAGNNNACAALATDQLGQPRSVAGSVPLDGPRICDIGAVEFFLPVNQLVSERKSERVTEYDPTPAPGAPAGTFLIIAKFDNISDTSPPGPLFANKTIFFPFFEVAAIRLSRTGAPPEEQPVLLNADRGPGRVGARLTPQGSLTTPFTPGATGTFQFLIGLQKREPFVLFVNMLGEPRSSVP